MQTFIMVPYKWLGTTITIPSIYICMLFQEKSCNVALRFPIACYTGHLSDLLSKNLLSSL